ncbi:hypothetical protein QM716_16000 [Rhodococcus sp. IEGM 1409]|nr:hypothetical protein [Rhodococcus sp. IEGM 1409]MDI9901362.1 hypothetical protein [Rhodococcus sp. IEGM 1409]
MSVREKESSDREARQVHEADHYAVAVGGSGVSADVASSTSDPKFGTPDSPCGEGDATGATAGT